MNNPHRPRHAPGDCKQCDSRRVTEKKRYDKYYAKRVSKAKDAEMDKKALLWLKEIGHGR